jgi:transcriptional regulator with XRE-family HTH domain
MDSLYEKLSYTVRKHRKEKELSTHQLAANLHVSSGLINNIENAKNDVFKLDLLVSLLKELNIPAQDILSNELVTISNLCSHDKQDKVDLVLSNNKLKNLEHIREYIPIIANSLLEIISRFEDTSTSTKLVCNYVIKNLDDLKKILSIK